jgi:phosphatidylinositol-3-phosphatase
MVFTRLVRLFAATALTASVLTGTLAADAATPAGDATTRTTADGRREVLAPVTITKIVTFMVENHSLDEMRTSMPYVHQLATTYAYATNYTAVRHPSLPNYIAIASGTTQGVTDDRDPSAHKLRGTTVFDQAVAHGKTAAIYAEGMTSNCQQTSRYPYAVKHNPWAYFVDGRASCQRNDVPLTRLAHDIDAGTLPNAGMIIPNLIRDAHDATLKTSDAWIKTQVEQIQAGPDWQSGHLVIVITADEDDGASGNKVLTVVASRYQDQRVVTSALSHYSLTQLYESILGVRYLAAATDAASMRSAFGIHTISNR